jgi:CHAT domain-containing protein/tetratricopeptide (TPR) repeat protein
MCCSVSGSVAIANDSPAVRKYQQTLADLKAITDSDSSATEKAEGRQKVFTAALPEMRGRVNAAMQAGKLSAALTWSERSVTLAKAALPAGHVQRSELVLLRAQLKFYEFGATPKPDAAATLTILEDAATEARTGGHVGHLFEALNRIALIQSKSGGKDLSGFARLLSVAEQTEKSASAVRSAAILFVWSNLWLPSYLSAGSGQSDESPDVAAERLEQQLITIHERLVAAHAPKSLAHAGELFLARLHVESLNLDAAKRELDQLDEHIEFQRMPAFWQIQHRIVKGRRASNLALFSEARSEFEAALQTAKTAAIPDLQAVVQINLGALLLRQGDYSLAEEFLRDAADAYKDIPALQNDPQRPIVMVNLAKTYEADGRFSKAVRLYKDAITLTESAANPNPSTLALCRNNLAACEYLAGNFDSAHKLFTQVEPALIGVFGAEHLRIAELKSNFAWLKLESGDTQAARKQFHESLDLARRTVGDAHPRTAEIMSYAARADFLLGDVEAAISQLRTALVLREQHLNRTLRSALSERDRLAIIQELRVHPESSAWPGVFDTWLDLAPALNIPVEEQYHGVLAWKGALDRHDFKATQSTAAPTVEMQQREVVLNELRTIYYAGAGRLSRRERRERIESLEAEANQLERRIAQSSGVAFREPVTLERLRESLPPRTAFLDVIQIRQYTRRAAGEEVVERRSSPGFLIRADAPVARVEFGDVKTLNEAAQEFFAVLSAGGLDYETSGRVLAEKIRVPLEPLLKDIDCLIICGDGLLHLLPLGALPDQEPDSFWIDRMAFVSVGSAHSFVERISHKTVVAPRTGLVIGGLDYGTPAEGDGKWTPLPGTLREARRVTELMKPSLVDCVLLTGTAPTESVVRGKLLSSQFVHLATHGFFGGRADRQTDGFEVLDISQELDSAIALAGANVPTEKEDELLTAAELRELDLRHIRLMVLSACQTGLGHIRAGQGLVGLLGALSRSGVRSTISSLWEVNDEATANLMTEFYTHMQRDPGDVDLGQSLRFAQLKLRSGEIRPSSGGTFKHPRFWAAFFLSGVPQMSFVQ